MLAFAFGSHHIEGGAYFMVPLTFLFAMNAALLIFILVNKNGSSLWIEVYKHIGLAILAYGIFGTLIGFLNMFDALESIAEDLPRQIIAGGVKVALLPVIYGSLYFTIIQTIYIVLSVLKMRRQET